MLALTLLFGIGIFFGTGRDAIPAAGRKGEKGLTMFLLDVTNPVTV